MAHSKDTYGVVIKVDDLGGATIRIPDAEYEEEAEDYLFWEELDLDYSPKVGDNVVIMWFGEDKERVLRKIPD